MTLYQYVEQQGYFLDLKTLRGPKGGPGFKKRFYDTFYNDPVKSKKVYRCISLISYDQSLDFVFSFSDIPFYQGQKPIRVNYLGANSSNDIICYLYEDFEGKAEYEKNLLTDATKEHAENKTTNKRRM